MCVRAHVRIFVSYTYMDYNNDMKKRYNITLEEGTWQQLEDIAKAKGIMYLGQPSRSAVIEKFVAGYAKKKEQPVDSQAQPDTIKEEIPAVQTSRPVRAVPKPAKKK